MFESNSLLIKKRSNRTDLKLTKTNILFLSEDFAKDDNGFIYTYSDSIKAFTCNPFSKISTLEYKKPIKDILATEKGIVVLNDDSIFLLGKFFNSFFNNFSSGKLVPLKKFDSVPCLFAVVLLNEIQIFNENLQRIKILEGQSIFYTEKYLAVGNLNILTVYSDKTIKIALPDMITCVAGLKDQSKIFCACRDNNIYSLTTTMGTLEYHNKNVKEMKISNERYLYSNDGNRICMWDIESEVVMGYIIDEKGFDKIEVMDLSERSYDFNLNLLE